MVYISGVEFGRCTGNASGVEVLVASNKNGKLGKWLSDRFNTDTGYRQPKRLEKIFKDFY
ncbi:MAG: hypothetical protein ACXWWD_06700 [Chitinophagaceae bacterium]